MLRSITAISVWLAQKNYLCLPRLAVWVAESHAQGSLWHFHPSLLSFGEVTFSVLLSYWDKQKTPTEITITARCCRNTNVLWWKEAQHLRIWHHCYSVWHNVIWIVKSSFYFILSFSYVCHRLWAIKPTFTQWMAIFKKLLKHLSYLWENMFYCLT